MKLFKLDYSMYPFQPKQECQEGGYDDYSYNITKLNIMKEDGKPEDFETPEFRLSWRGKALSLKPT